MTDEIGKEYTVDDLRALAKPVVVVTRREDRDVGVTLWLEEVGPTCVLFTAQGKRVLFLTFIEGDHVVDDTGRRVHVYEYLGEV